MKTLRTLFMVCLMVLGLAGSAMAQQQIIVANNIGEPIPHMFVENSAGQVSDDLIAPLGEPLGHGDGVQIFIEGDTKGWTLVITDGETPLAWDNLDLTGVSTIVINSDATLSFQ